MPGSSSQKTPASATAKTPKSGLVQKAITSFFKTPAPPSAGNAPSSPARSAEKKQAKLTDGAWGGRPSSAAPSSAAKSTPAATPSGVRPVVSAPLSSAVDRSDDLAVTVLDDDEEFATPSRARPVSDDDEEIVVSAKRKLKRPAIGESSDEEAVSAKKSGSRQTCLLQRFSVHVG